MHEDAAGWPFSKELMIFIVTCQLGDLLVRCVGTWPAAAKRIGRLHAAARRALTIKYYSLYLPVQLYGTAACTTWYQYLLIGTYVGTTV